MLRQQREEEVLRLLAAAEDGTLRVVDLARLLGVSEMTVRRDLAVLEARGLLQRVHGGAMQLGQSLLLEKSFGDRVRERLAEKLAIGREAARLVHDGEVIILDAGTTTLQVARHIAARRLTAVTNALPVATELVSHPTVATIMLGGSLKAPELCTVGSITTGSLAEMAADTVFLSTAAFSLERGLSDPDLREVAVKQAMIRAARRVVLVCDSSKAGAVAFARTTPLASLAALVTDAGLPVADREAIEAVGIEVIVAGGEAVALPAADGGPRTPRPASVRRPRAPTGQAF
jgi:DeoR family fructose operon transcriptional repressor